MNEKEWGQPPQDEDAFTAVSVDPAGIQQFWADHYVSRFIPQGGSKVKWIRGREGSGKSHALRQLAYQARNRGMVAVALDAHVTSLRGIHEFVRAVLHELPYGTILGQLSQRVIQNMGYQPNEVPAGVPFLSWLVDVHGRIRKRAISDIHEAVDRTIDPLDIDLNLKTAIGFGLDQVFKTTDADSADIDMWFRGEKVGRSRLAAVKLSTSLSKLNARAVLQGWGVTTLAAGLPGILITVDGFEQVMAPKTEGAPHYTPRRREETYEMVRQFIDDGDSLTGIWIVFSATGELFEEKRRGFKSYPALDARVLNVVQSQELNRFEDQLDWDRIWEESPGLLDTLISRWADFFHLPPSPPVAHAGTVSPVRRSILALRQERII